MRLLTLTRFACALGVLSLVPFGGHVRAQANKDSAGSCGPLFGATICSSYQMRAGKITSFTLRVPLAMIEHAPADAPMVWPPKPDLNVRFAPIVQQKTGFTYASIYLEPQGHDPAAYHVPHFDFHFYFVPERKVETIDCKDKVKPQVLPAGYSMSDLREPQPLGVLVGSCIPDMGMHASPDADINNKTPWKASVLVGYYDASPIFFEPMITRSLLLDAQSFSLPVPQDVAPSPHVRYPRTFRAVYLPKAKAYDLTFFY